MIAAFFLGVLLIWAVVGFWWMAQFADSEEPGAWAFIFMGGPVSWGFVCCVFIYCLGLGLHAIYSDCMSALHLWSIRPAERAVEEYLTNGGCHERH